MVTSDTQETQINVRSETQVKSIGVKSSMGTDKHDKLVNRDLPGQHPIGAITGLQEALDDCVDDAELEAALLEKQDTLTAGANIQINGKTISAIDTTYIAGTGISIVGNVISSTQTSAEWGNITGSISTQTDLWNILEEKANTADIPTATSDLLNDSGFITLSALSGYATQNWVENKGYITNAALVGYATESYVTTVVGTETTNRQNADNNLQSQIDAITASSDVTDIVGTYAELQSYDTSTLPPNSIIKVLQDESRNNKTTYYRWVITSGVGAWSLIGEEGPYYTISAADAKFATQTALSTGLSGKQATLVSGTNIKTVGGNSLLGSGNIALPEVEAFTAAEVQTIWNGVS